MDFIEFLGDFTGKLIVKISEFLDFLLPELKQKKSLVSVAGLSVMVFGVFLMLSMSMVYWQCFVLGVLVEVLGYLLNVYGHYILSKSLKELTGYCVKCRVTVPIKDPEPVVTRNNKKALKGTCPTCGTMVMRLGKWLDLQLIGKED